MMPNLSEVCVWEGFNANNLVKDSVGSPNVYFTTDCQVTSLNSHKDGFKLLGYPNPSDNIIFLELANTNNATIEIYSINGKLITKRSVQSKLEKIDVSGFSEGLYVVKVQQSDTVYIGRVAVWYE